MLQRQDLECAFITGIRMKNDVGEERCGFFLRKLNEERSVCDPRKTLGQGF